MAVDLNRGPGRTHNPIMQRNIHVVEQKIK
jgi:hypothetical protein